eukprot:22864-Rhodomonas_salina.3
MNASSEPELRLSLSLTLSLGVGLKPETPPVTASLQLSLSVSESGLFKSSPLLRTAQARQTSEKVQIPHTGSQLEEAGIGSTLIVGSH